MSKRLIKSYIIILIIVIILASIGGFIIYKPSVHDAEIHQLININGIGEVRAELIVTYLENNKTATIEDLERIDGIGCITLSKIRKRWR